MEHCRDCQCMFHLEKLNKINRSTRSDAVARVKSKKKKKKKYGLVGQLKDKALPNHAEYYM